jgi:hypothetical protein
MQAQRDIHLVGSVPLGSARDVFTACGKMLGARAARLPDGETGERSNWIACQTNLFQAPMFEPLPKTDKAMAARFSLADGATPRFGSLGYAKAARASWQDFHALRAAGTLPTSTRFQVSLPTPLAVVVRNIRLEDQAAVEPAYTKALLDDLTEIVALVPAADLAIQWDVAIEVAVLEEILQVHFESVFDGIIERLAQLAESVPEAAEVGFHFCYGDFGHRHFKEPQDTGLLVRLANALAAHCRRTIDWIHMPVPRDRADASYFKPLRDLSLPSSCRLFLGLVHLTDGLEGTRRRIRVAEEFAPSDFGIATECGFGRRAPATVMDLLQLHVDV